MRVEILPGTRAENVRLLPAAGEVIRLRDDVLAAVSHDLRSPLGTVSMGIAVLRRSLSGRGPELAADVEIVLRMERACRRMDRLIEDMHDASKLDTGTFVVVPRAMRVRDLVRDMAESATELAEAVNVGVRIDDIEDFRVMADRGRVLQVFLNLVDMAMKATPRDGTVVVSAERIEGYGRFAVKVGGPGIPRKHHGRLFEKDWTGDKKNPGGQGLGLHIARGIVEAHRGHMDVWGDEGEGTTLTFTLPLALET